MSNEFSYSGLAKDHAKKRIKTKRTLRITPNSILSLACNEVFVFESNAKGMHSKGAARIAYNEFGAEWGNGEGLQGKSYAIPTMDGRDLTKKAIRHFTQFARKHSELFFLVTPIGCCFAGYTAEEIAPLFKPASLLKNVFLPSMFWEVILKM